MSFLELTGVQKRFGTTVAVEDFNLAAEQGESDRVIHIVAHIGIENEADRFGGFSSSALYKAGEEKRRNEKVNQPVSHC